MTDPTPPPALQPADSAPRESAAQDPQHLRVGAFHRERAISELRNAAADDRISFAELDDRVPQALQARTRGNLAAVLGDLLTADELAALFGETINDALGPGHTWDNPIQLKPTGWGRLDRLDLIGEWEAPPFIEVVYSMGGVLIDFSRAHAVAPIIDLVLVGSNYGSAVIIVPEGWGVDTEAIRNDASANVNCAVPTRPVKGGVRVVIRGRVNASVKVRTPTKGDERRNRRSIERNPDATTELIRAQITSVDDR